MEYGLEGAIAVQLLILVVLIVYLAKIKGKVSFYEKKYSAIIEIDKEVEKLNLERQKIDKEIESLRNSYKEKKEIFDKLVKEVAIYDEEIQLAELGFYKPHFDFDTSEKYKEKIAEIKTKQKQLLSDKKAIFCTTEWTVHGSKAKGKTFANRAVRLTARAFNNECDSAISNVAWNNAGRMEMRIEKAFDAINKLNESNSIVISNSYLSLKMDELRLTHEYREKKQQEKEEQAEIRRQMREEAQLERDVENAIKEEEKYEKLLNKAKVEAEKAAGEKLEKLNEQMERLKLELEEAHAKSERAKSMAQQTKSGHVYVISNIGSFGENVYKIGMTRRLEPQDRVKELGDASVPFTFDVHAMIYSDGFYPVSTDGLKTAEKCRSCLATLRRILGLWNRSM
jgi:chromosome segregation ATPase